MNNNVKLNNYNLLKILFISGHLISVILTFVPSINITKFSYLSFRTETISYSTYDLIQEFNQKGELGLQLFLVFMFSLSLAYIILSIIYPKRWVFLSSAIINSFVLLLSLFSKNNPEITYLFYPQLLTYLGVCLTLLGYFTIPQKNYIKDEIS